MILQVRTTIVDIFMRIDIFIVKKFSRDVDLEEVTSCYIRYIYFVKIVIFVWVNSTDPRQNQSKLH